MTAAHVKVAASPARDPRDPAGSLARDRAASPVRDQVASLARDHRVVMTVMMPPGEEPMMVTTLPRDHLRGGLETGTLSTTAEP